MTPQAEQPQAAPAKFWLEDGFTDDDARALGFPSLKSLVMAPKIMQTYRDLMTQPFGRLSVVAYFPSDRSNGIRQRAEVLCECGTVKTVDVGGLKSGLIRSCGCLHREITGNIRRTHGLSRTPEYCAWSNAIRRCTLPSDINYLNYGGRGISVCKRWLDSVSNFYADLGPRPTPLHSLERLDNDGNYEPSNCVWATREDQNRNQRRTVYVEWEGERLPALDLAKRLGIKPRFLYGRLRAGISIIEAINIPKYHAKVPK